MTSRSKGSKSKSKKKRAAAKRHHDRQVKASVGKVFGSARRRSPEPKPKAGMPMNRQIDVPSANGFWPKQSMHELRHAHFSSESTRSSTPVQSLQVVKTKRIVLMTDPGTYSEVVQEEGSCSPDIAQVCNFAIDAIKRICDTHVAQADKIYSAHIAQMRVICNAQQSQVEMLRKAISAQTDVLAKLTSEAIPIIGDPFYQ